MGAFDVTQAALDARLRERVAQLYAAQDPVPGELGSGAIERVLRALEPPGRLRPPAGISQLLAACLRLLRRGRQLVVG